jgi:site-specific DNA-methyltransferase (adenine-specific)/site-specific DNA-methyltransferase (cytosine-N4-specific)
MTSPPYAMQRKDKYGGVLEDDYVKWFSKIANNLANVLSSDGSFFLNIKAHSDMGERSLYVMDLMLSLKSNGWRFIDEFCWLRNPPPGSWPNRFKNGFEPIYHLSKSTDIKFRPDNVKDKSRVGESYASSNINNQDWFNTAHEGFQWDGSLPSNVLDYRKNAPGTGHSAAFPIEVPEFFIKAFSDKDDIWLDPFVGSGTTILACELNGRSGIGIDKDPDMVAICLERLSKNLKTTPERSEGWLNG